MSTTVMVKASTPERAKKVFAQIRGHWAMREISWSGPESFVLVAANRPARRSVSNLLRRLGVTFTLTSSAPLKSTRGTLDASNQLVYSTSTGGKSPESMQLNRFSPSRRKGRVSHRPPDEELLWSLRNRGLEGTARYYGVKASTVRGLWAKNVPGAAEFFPDGRKTKMGNAVAV